MRIDKKKFIIKYAISFLTIYLITVFSRMVVMSDELLTFDKFVGYCSLSKKDFIVFFCISLIIALLICIYKNSKEKINKNIYTYRWLYACLLIVVLVAFKIHGSSVGLWGEYFIFDGNKTKPLLGVNRAIRSDEWGLFTPLAFSQGMNNHQYYSSFWRGTSTDMFLVYGQAVLDIVQLFRPFQIGYLFLPEEYGLSFYWVSRYVVLFVITYDFFRVFTKKNHALSLIAAILITLSPAIQWWFSINSLIEIFISGFLGILMLHYLLKTTNRYQKLLYTFGLTIALGTYTFSIYPSWQIPMAYIFFILLIIVFVDNKKEYKWEKANLFFFMIAIVSFILISFRIYLLSKGTYTLMSNTVYPGKRFELGGAGSNLLFNGYEDLFSSLFYKNVTEKISPMSNVVEHATFLDFFPLPIVIGILYSFITKKKRDYGVSLALALSLFFLSWILVSWPPLLAKITLFSNVPVGRMMIPFGFINIVLLIRILAIVNVKEMTNKQKQLTLITLAITLLFILLGLKQANLYFKSSNIPDYIIAAIFLIISVLLCTYFKISTTRKWITNTVVYLIFIVSIASSFFVNPISNYNGLTELKKSELSQKIQKINRPNTKWITISDFFIQNNYLPTLGVETINSTNTYPNLELWERLFPKDKNAYNRYAHIDVQIVSTESKIIAGIDSFKTEVNVNDLKKIEVKYILSTKKLEGLDTNQTKLVQLEKINNIYIYECVYLT